MSIISIFVSCTNIRIATKMQCIIRNSTRDITLIIAESHAKRGLFFLRNRVNDVKYSGVARRRKVGGGAQTLFKKSEKGHRDVKALDGVLWVGEGFLI